MKKLCVSLLLYSLSTLADQAAYVSKAKAEEAVVVINKTRLIKTFCAPCDDSAALEVVVENVDASAVNHQQYWQVKVNGRGIDLAYVYINENQRWRNLAMILNLPVQGVPEFIP